MRPRRQACQKRLLKHPLSNKTLATSGETFGAGFPTKSTLVVHFCGKMLLQNMLAAWHSHVLCFCAARIVFCVRPFVVCEEDTCLQVKHSSSSMMGCSSHVSKLHVRRTVRKAQPKADFNQVAVVCLHCFAANPSSQAVGRTWRRDFPFSPTGRE